MNWRSSAGTCPRSSAEGQQRSTPASCGRRSASAWNECSGRCPPRAASAPMRAWRPSGRTTDPCRRQPCVVSGACCRGTHHGHRRGLALMFDEHRLGAVAGASPATPPAGMAPERLEIGEKAEGALPRACARAMHIARLASRALWSGQRLPLDDLRPGFPTVVIVFHEASVHQSDGPGPRESARLSRVSCRRLWSAELYRRCSRAGTGGISGPTTPAVTAA